MSPKPTRRRVGRPSSLARPTGPLPSQPVTKAAFARLLNCPAPRVSEWIRSGILSVPALTTSGTILVAAAIERLDAAGMFAQPKVEPTIVLERLAAAGQGDTDAAPMTYDEARTATETLKAHRALLDLRARRGELVELVTAERVLFAATRGFRDGLVTWPPRVAAEMASRLGVPPAKLLTELERGVREFLAGLSDPKAEWRR